MLISEDDIIRCSSRREGQALEENLGAGISRGGRGLARPPLSGLPPAHCKTACIPHRHYIACFYCFTIIYHQIIHFLTIKSTISLFAPLQQKKCLTNKNRSAIWMHCCCKDAQFTSSSSFLQRNHDPCALFYCSRLFFLIHFIDLFIDLNNFTDFPSMFLACNLSKFGWFNVSWVHDAVLVCWRQNYVAPQPILSIYWWCNPHTHFSIYFLPTFRLPFLHFHIFECQSTQPSVPVIIMYTLSK